MAPRVLGAALFLAATLGLAAAEDGPASVIEQALLGAGGTTPSTSIAGPAAGTPEGSATTTSVLANPAAANPAAAAVPAAANPAVAAKLHLCEALSCANVFHPGGGCQCNPKCKAFGNCCADYDQACGAQHAHSEPTTTRPTGPTRTTTTTSPRPPWPAEVLRLWPDVNKVVEFDIYRAMVASGLDMHPMEDDDVADLGGVLKYIITEIIVESQGNPDRSTRKYGINSITKHRFKLRNPDALLENSEHVAYGEFGQFVTYDWGKASNLDQEYMLKKYGDFVGVQGCPRLSCDPRYPSDMPYSWLSLGNWCPNLPFNMKGTKKAPHVACLRDLNHTVLLGGLCPNGFNAKGLSPPVDPTGETGCVYSYGRGETVLLDELVGITEEDCGGEKCRNWLHFRNNCSNPKYKMKFNLQTETVVRTEYCVEHDIHPKCQRDCWNRDCQAIIGSGGIAYLGLPFWRDICDPRANIRRMERVAYALGTEGALTRHQVVDERLANATCRPSVGSSSPCVPVRPGQSGPFCSRYFNGACEPCFIPGTVVGPASRPTCPLDVYENYEGLEKPECMSRKASDGCCLYDGSCEGDSDPESATLDTEGYALVAGRHSTEDMATFLTRAVSEKYPELQSLLDDEDQVSYAAYGAWGRQPANQTLHEAVQEFGRNLKGLAAPSRKVLSLPAELLPWQCFQIAVSFLPLDMDGTLMSHEDSALACQQRCQRIEGCAHFTFRPVPGQEEGSGSCHLQDIAAEPVDDSTGYIAGPSSCWEDIDVGAKASLVDIGYQTYVPSDLACMQRGIRYHPLLIGEPIEVISSSTREDAIGQCQKLCNQKPGCGHYSIIFPEGLCSMAPPQAVTVKDLSSVSGPAICTERVKSTYWELYAQREPSEPDATAWARARAWATPATPLLGGGIGAVAALGSVLLVYRAGRHAFPGSLDHRALVRNGSPSEAAMALEHAQSGMDMRGVSGLVREEYEYAE